MLHSMAVQELEIFNLSAHQILAEFLIFSIGHGTELNLILDTTKVNTTEITIPKTQAFKTYPIL